MLLNQAAAASQANSRETVPNAVTFQNHFIAIFKEGALFSARKLQRFSASPGALQQGTAILFIRARYCSTCKQVTRAQRATVRRMMRDHLR